jgi:DNA-directed RNA polymerase specialized sigma24 family protein
LTSPRPLKFENKSRDHETIFLNHYDWLLDWARQHTQGASEEAEDLVQDLYVRFVQMKSGPVFTDDDQIRAYLYTSLKNLFISRKLRSGRDAVSGLLAVDFDSVAFAVSAVDRSQLLHVRSDLAGICEYACIRRKTHRAGAALILRFFLGYTRRAVVLVCFIFPSYDPILEKIPGHRRIQCAVSNRTERLFIRVLCRPDSALPKADGAEKRMSSARYMCV